MSNTNGTCRPCPGNMPLVCTQYQGKVKKVKKQWHPKGDRLQKMSTNPGKQDNISTKALKLWKLCLGNKILFQLTKDK